MTDFDWGDLVLDVLGDQIEDLVLRYVFDREKDAKFGRWGADVGTHAYVNNRYGQVRHTVSGLMELLDGEDWRTTYRRNRRAMGLAIQDSARNLSFADPVAAALDVEYCEMLASTGRFGLLRDNIGRAVYRTATFGPAELDPDRLRAWRRTAAIGLSRRHRPAVGRLRSRLATAREQEPARPDTDSMTAAPPRRCLAVFDAELLADVVEQHHATQHAALGADHPRTTDFALVAAEICEDGGFLALGGRMREAHFNPRARSLKTAIETGLDPFTDRAADAALHAEAARALLPYRSLDRAQALLDHALGRLEELMDLMAEPDRSRDDYLLVDELRHSLYFTQGLVLLAGRRWADAERTLRQAFLYLAPPDIDSVAPRAYFNTLVYAGRRWTAART